MTTSNLHQVLAANGTYEFLQALERSNETALLESPLLEMMSSLGIESPESTFDDLLAANLLQRLGVRFGISNLGIRSVLLLEALNGGDIRLAYQRLSNLDSSLRTYELVREGMTDLFFENLNMRPGFSRLYISSPWINLTDRNRGFALHAMHLAEQRGAQPELFVITRPDGDGNAPAGVAPLQQLGASVFLNGSLHSKLYIREPDKRGGYSMAMVGSQNLTRSQYLELGIRINSDSTMVDQLIAYFWELSNASREVGAP